MPNQLIPFFYQLAASFPQCVPDLLPQRSKGSTFLFITSSFNQHHQSVSLITRSVRAVAQAKNISR